MYRVEINYPKAPSFSRDFGTAREALDCYEMVKGLSNHCVKVFIFNIESKQVEPSLLAECLMQWGRAKKLKEV